MIKLKDLLSTYFTKQLKKVKIAYGSEVFLYGYDDIDWLMDKYVRDINIYHSVIFISVKDKGIDDGFDEYTETIIRKFKTES